MPAVVQTEQPRGTGSSSYSETPEQKAGWEKLADWIEEQVTEGLLLEGDTFSVQGYVYKMNLSPEGKFFSKEITDRNTKEKKITTYTEVEAVITDPRFCPAGVLLPLPRKQLGTSFFDGRMRDGSRGIARGAMYHLHLAVTFAEPPADLVANKGSWDTDDYTGRNHPVLLVVTFAGWEQEGSQYYGQRSWLKVFLDKFERDMAGRKARFAQAKAAPAVAVTGGEFDDETEGEGLTGIGVPSLHASPTTRRGRAASKPATEVHDDAADTPFVTVVGEPVAAPTRSRRAAASAGAVAAPAAASTATAPVGDPAAAKATERQVKFIYAIAREAGLDDGELNLWSQELYNQEVEELNRRDASALIESLQRRRNEVA